MNDLVPRDLTRLADGHSAYCVMCYDHGGIVEDGIVVRFSAERLWWVGGPAPAEEWILSHAWGRDVTVRSFHEDIHVASLQGPASRTLLDALAEADIAALPFFGMVETRIAGLPVVITRTGYTAELGYDIYVEVRHGAALFAALWAALEPQGVALCGSRALDLRRTEAAILNIGQEFDMRVTPLEIGLDRMINWTKGDFRGRAALDRQRREGVRRRLVGLMLDGEDVAVPGEPVLDAGRKVGEVTTGNWSPALEASLAIAMVSAEAAAPGTRLAVAIDGRPAAATVVPMPFLDPERRLSKA
jgi:aminomethyltransferase